MCVCLCWCTHIIQAFMRLAWDTLRDAYFFKKGGGGCGSGYARVTQEKGLATLLKDPSSVPRTHIARNSTTACNSSSWRTHTHVHTTTHIHTIHHGYIQYYQNVYCGIPGLWTCFPISGADSLRAEKGCKPVHTLNAKMLIKGPASFNNHKQKTLVDSSTNY